MTDTTPGLSSADLPSLYEAADTASLRGQRQYINSVRLRLALAITAAVTGAVTWTMGADGFDIAAVGTAIALAAAAYVELSLRSARPEVLWYDGRALAESTKSLAWRFSACGVPFERGDTGRDNERHFIDEVKKLLDDAPDQSVKSSRRPVVSDRMRALRAADLPTRKAAYLKSRILDQHDWYSRKAELNDKMASRWRNFLLTIEVTGICAALAKALGYINLDLAGIVGAVIAAGTAWLGLRQHTTLARAYTVAANELMIAHGRLQLVTDESDWAKEVADSEEAISREHTMWRASRSRSSS